MNPDTDTASPLGIPSFILAEKEAINRICKETRVSKMWLFGSSMREDFDPRRSDLDFVVDFADPDAPGISDRYFALVEQLEKTFRRPVDIITSRSIKNPVFAGRVNASRKPIYAA